VKLVVGLGNPGKKYQHTRHNIGFRVIDHIAAQQGVSVNKKRCDSLVGEWILAGEKILLVKPQTYMNRSGEAIKGLLREFRASGREMVVVYDDLDLPFGRIRVRPGGSAGGHRGALSILESLAGAAFFRVRVGIGRPPEGVDPADFVLTAFTSDEVEHLNALIDRAANAVICLLREGGERAMLEFNRAR
jgi:PTH1 family peptidyl-tRNA hydrolase